MTPKGAWMTLQQVAADLGYCRITRKDLDRLGIPYVARGRMPRVPESGYRRWQETMGQRGAA